VIGRVLAAANAVAFGDRAVLDRIGGPIGEAARTAGDRLEAMAPQARKTKRGTWAAASRASIPPGLRGVDPSWIETALEGVPSGARAALSSGATTEVEVWLARWACTSIPPMRAVDAAMVRPREVADAARLAAPALHAWLEEIGADQLAFALGPYAATASAVFGTRLFSAGARIGVAPRVGALGQRRAAIDRARVDPDPVALVRIGARALAPHTDPLLRRQLVHRLPRPLGLAVARELRVYARAPAGDAPTWAALAAP